MQCHAAIINGNILRRHGQWKLRTAIVHSECQHVYPMSTMSASLSCAVAALLVSFSAAVTSNPCLGKGVRRATQHLPFKDCLRMQRLQRKFFVTVH